jgi:hydrogenase maturation protease
MLIIGCGNRQRGDDAAGIFAAERLRALGIPAEICSGESSELMELWSNVDDVIVIDAVVTDSTPGAVHLWVAQRPLHYGKASGSTHGLGVAEAIELARALDCLPQRLRIYGIEGRQFEIGSKVSPEVVRAVEEIVQRIMVELRP